MTTPEQNEINNYVQRIIEKTGGGHIVWSHPNPSTYVWINTSPPAQVTLQKIEQPSSRVVNTGGRVVLQTTKTYIFTVIDRNQPNKPVLTLNTNTDQFFMDTLDKLFNLLEQEEAKKATNFLKDLVN
jgi:hypothetical protein